MGGQERTNKMKLFQPKCQKNFEIKYKITGGGRVLFSKIVIKKKKSHKNLSVKNRIKIILTLITKWMQVAI